MQLISLDSKELAETIKRLENELKKAGLNPQFSKSDPQLTDTLKEQYSLPEIYVEFLQNYNPKNVVINPSPFQEIEFYPTEYLEEGQLGYAVNSETGDRIESWSDSWVVFAYDAGDPYFFDTSKKWEKESPVFSARHGQGSWEPHLVASTFSQFLLILIEWLNILGDPECYDKRSAEISDEGIKRLKEMLLKIDDQALKSGHWWVE